MKRLTRWGRVVSHAVHTALPFVLEGTMAGLSGRAAWILLANQDYFDQNPASYAWLVDHITSHEWIMGTLAAVASALKVVGLLGVRVRAAWAADLVFGLRQFGWTASCIFWGLVGTSILVGAPHTLGSANTIALGIVAATMMLSGPAMPEVRNGP